MYHNNTLAADGQLMDEESKPGVAVTYPAVVTPCARRSLRVLFATMCLAAVSACSSNYVIQSADGTVYHTQGAPSLAGGAYTFVDAEGKQQQIFLSQVTRVVPR
jgi:hypothetical protein